MLEEYRISIFVIGLGLLTVISLAGMCYLAIKLRNYRREISDAFDNTKEMDI